jgi:DNA gyrase subunit B
MEGASLTKFLLNVQEYVSASAKMSRKLREPELVDILAASNLEKKTDFEDKKALEKLAKAIDKAKLEIETKIVYDEEHSLYDLLIPGNAAHPGDKKINWAFASTPEYKRLRASANLISELDRPPFTVTRSGDKPGEKIVKEKASDVLSYILEDAKKDFTITRFKGLGEMNPDQLWETTMNAETRTLLKVRLDDATAAEEIFSTLMGENVESRRKFIEENALEVVNLDI